MLKSTWYQVARKLAKAQRHYITVLDLRRPQPFRDVFLLSHVSKEYAGRFRESFYLFQDFFRVGCFHSCCVDLLIMATDLQQEGGVLV